MDTHVRSDQRVRDAPGDPLDAGALENDRVLDLAALDITARADRRVGADEGVVDLGAGPDDRRAAQSRPDDPGPGLENHLALDAAAGVDVLEPPRVER